jgi:hypothetical protein
MDRNTYRDDDEEEEEGPHTYWRRRAFTLTAGLGVLGLLAWALSGGGGGKPAASPQASATSGSMSAAAYPNSPASSTGSPSGAAATAGANASVPGLSAPGTSGLPPASSTAARKPAASGPSPLAGAASGSSSGTYGSCPSNAIVLSLFGSKSGYAKGQDPKFTLDTVSTAAGTCTLDASPAQLHLVVMASGRVIWDSADCAKSSQAQSDNLARGVPVQQGFSWSRAVTLPGCKTLASSAQPGTYTAQAKAGPVASAVRTFKLTG